MRQWMDNGQWPMAHDSMVAHLGRTPETKAKNDRGGEGEDAEGREGRATTDVRQSLPE